MDYLHLVQFLALIGLFVYAFRAHSKGGERDALPDWARIQLEQLERERKEAISKVERAREQELEWVRKESELRAKVNTAEQRAQTAEEALQQFTADEHSRREAMKNEFKLLAGSIFEERSTAFKNTNADALGQLLQPFKDKLDSFEREVKKAQENEQKNTGALLNQLNQLQQLNTELSQEAQALTRALKGENKTQGNWGEYVLERALELSGLQKGVEYEVQQSETTASGRRLQPDVVVHLPGNKHIVVDSKVSLSAWERFVNAPDPEAANAEMKAHLASLKKHIKSLSEKDYTQLFGGATPEFVLLFIPIESAFIEATKFEMGLYDLAFDQRIILVTTSTLLATLKTVAMSWRQDKQQKNVLEIAELGGRMLDKFAQLSGDIRKIGEQMDTVKRTQEAAMIKLTGRGGLVGQAEKLQKLGAKTRKSIDSEVARLTELNKDTPTEEA